MPDQLDPEAIAALDRLIEARRAGYAAELRPLDGDGDAAELLELADLAVALERHWAEAPALDGGALWTRVHAGMTDTPQRRRPWSALGVVRAACRSAPVVARAAVVGAATMLGGLALLLGVLALQRGRADATFLTEVHGLSGFAQRALTDQHVTSAEQAEVERRVQALALAVEGNPQALQQLDAAQLESAASALGGLSEWLTPLAAEQPGARASVESLAALTQRVQDARHALAPPAGLGARARTADERGGHDDDDGGRPENARAPASPGVAAATAARAPARTAEAVREASATRTARATTPAPTAAPASASSGVLAARFAFCSDGPRSNVADCQEALDEATRRCTPAASRALSRDALERCMDAIDSGRRHCERLQPAARDACRRQLELVAAQARQQPPEGARPTPAASGTASPALVPWRSAVPTAAPSRTATATATPWRDGWGRSGEWEHDGD